MDDLQDVIEAMETGVCPQCGCEVDNGTEDCENIIHDMV